MERKLSNSESRAIMAIVSERDEATAVLGEFLEFYASRHGFKKPALRMKQDGLYLVEEEGDE